MSEDAATGRRQGEPRALSCRAVARIVGARSRHTPHRHTIRNQVLKHLERDVDYLLTSGGMRIFPAAIGKILDKLYKVEQI